MQRKVKVTKINYATIEPVNGELTTKTYSTVIKENNVDKALKKFRKSNPNACVISTETIENLYVLDDEIFFKYAEPVEIENKYVKPVETENK